VCSKNVVDKQSWKLHAVSELRLSYKMRRCRTTTWITSMLSSCMQWFSSLITMALCWSMFLTKHSMNSYSRIV